MTKPEPIPSGEVAALALRLHSAVPAATDHPYRPLPNPTRTLQHLARRHRLDLDGEHAELFREHFTSPQQLHSFAHEPAEARALLAIALVPFVDQLRDILGQLPAALRPILLAETAQAVRLRGGRAPTDRHGQDDQR
jgi:hypothetical protein